MKTMAPPTFGDKLRQLRIERELTQAELAVMAGLNFNHISQFETGARLPSYPVLLDISRALGVSLSVFDDTAVAEKI